MLSVFPQLLFLAPAGIALIRLAAGLSFVYIGYAYWRDRSALSQEELPLLGRGAPWLWTVGGLLCVAIGILLGFGLWTQVAALLGALASLKATVLGARYAALFPLPRSSNALLLAICLALLVSGAGAFALDLRL